MPWMLFMRRFVISFLLLAVLLIPMVSAQEDSTSLNRGSSSDVLGWIASYLDGIGRAVADSMSQTLGINPTGPVVPPPVDEGRPVSDFSAHFFYYSRSDDLEVIFNASESFTSEGAYIISYHWDFGDGTNLETKSPVASHTYMEKGEYTIALAVLDSKYHQSLSTTKNIKFPDGPEEYSEEIIDLVDVSIQFVSTKNPVVYQPVVFRASHQLPLDEFPTSYSWDFGDGTKEIGPNVMSHSYKSAGFYTITAWSFLVKTPDIISKPGSISITVSYIEDYKPPIAKISVSSSKIKAGEPVTFS